MCGIVGYIGQKAAKPILLDGLKRLEYRGYDSAGFALMESKANNFLISRCVGQVQNLVDASASLGLSNTQGIAHTRWATHGAPSEVNAHPHRAGAIVLVHNGIIENHAELKQKLIQAGAKFSSQTDTEVFAQLIEYYRKTVSQLEVFSDQQSDAQKTKYVIEALTRAMKDVHGHYAILLMVVGIEGKIFGVQNGAPLAVTLAKDGTYLASDLQPLVVYSKQISFIPTGTIFEANATSIKYIDSKTLQAVEPKFETIDWSSEQVAKDGFEHFMLKEIHQQPMVVADTLSGRLPQAPGESFLWDHPEKHQALWKDARRIYLVACGTAYHAAMVAKYYFEQWARIPVDVDLASEFRYRNPVFEPGSVVGVVSQSGETADTLSALRLANAQGIPTFSVCNVPGSTISRESKVVYSTKAGPEIGVASTKAFTTQLTVLCSLALDLARLKNVHSKKVDQVLHALTRLPHDMQNVLTLADDMMKVGSELETKKTILFVGRGTMFPIALEGALKLKEITYRHAEGYAAGELKHGPIALVDKHLGAIVLAPSDELHSKTISNLEEIKSRGGMIIGIGDETNATFKNLCDRYIPMPPMDASVAPMIYVLPLQLISYGLAKRLECSIDKPRNLAKSVTVE